MLFFIFLILLGLGTFIFIRYQKHRKANKLYLEAKALEQKDTKNPYDLTKIKQALALYKQCKKLVNKPEYSKAVKQCQREIDDRYRFQYLLADGRKKVDKSYFKEALIEFVKAQKLFYTSELKAEISKCQDNIKQEESYEIDLKQSARMASQGRFNEALDLLIPAVTMFVRQDGEDLLNKLRIVVRGKDLYQLGLIAEDRDEIENAIANYRQALELIPEYINCRLRLAILAVKDNPQQAISYLQAVEGEQATYIRGFAYAQIKDWQQANREWRSINKISVDIQRSILKKIIDRDRLSRICEIENLLTEGQLEIAKSVSLEFIKKFGSDAVVKFNLESHIQPILEKSNWNDGNWQKTVTRLEQTWLEKQNIKSLHNWAIATYCQAQINSNKLDSCIIAWSTALANLNSDPTLQNVPWLKSSSIDLEDVVDRLKQILENAIDAVKDSKIDEYLRLRDIYRREMVALSLVKQNGCGVKIKQLFVLPGCYQRCRNYLPITSLPTKIWGALYTDWGLAVAACYENDTARAIKIKPSRSPSDQSDRFAYCFVSYHEGCYYLQNLDWRKAIKPFEQAKSEIRAESNWRKEIDRLCEAQRQKIKDFNEHWEFSKFWYELLDSQSARNYFAEQSAIQVGLKIDDKKISLQQGLDELRAIRNNIDRNNTTTLNLIETAEIQLELEKIDRAMQQEFKRAIAIAKQSRHERVRFRVAEVCIDILLKGAEEGSLNFDGMYQLAQWASELCPQEPAFMPIYNKLGIY